MCKPGTSKALRECSLRFFCSKFIFAQFTLSNQYPDNVIGPGSQYDNAYFEFKYVRVYGNGNSTVIGGTSTTGSAASSTRTASSQNSSSVVRNVESVWLVSWMCAVAAVMGVILY